ncbi:MAG: hypothetical protein DDT30_01133 [Dehalococcoidia bacterium]|nr:hypothetical protein [Bacillota bacterium]
MIDIINKDNGIIDHDTGNHNHPDKGDQRDGLTGNKKSQHYTNQSQRNTEYNGKGMKQRFKLSCHNHIDQKNSKEQNKKKAVESFYHVLILTAILNKVPRGNGYPRYHLFYLIHNLS